jgi:Glycosyltransferase sugar-binding region containing DXD motif
MTTVLATTINSPKCADKKHNNSRFMYRKVIFFWIFLCINAIVSFWYTFVAFTAFSKTIMEAGEHQHRISIEEWNGNFHRHASTVLGQLNFTSNGLLWFVPPPPSPRFLGWEDNFIQQFKKQHYKTSTNTSDLHCKVEKDNNPYQNCYVCEVPGYIPARMPLPSSSQQIPRVIFVSWSTRKLQVMQFISIMTILAHNPEYELIFMVDHEIDQYVCANYPDYVPYFSKLVSGAARVDVWRMMVIYKYGGVYLDFDNTAVGHIPVQSSDSFASSVRCDFSQSRKHIRGILEHWSFAAIPKQILMNRTLEIIKQNIIDPSRIEDPLLKKVVASKTQRLTGPVPFQEALHELLHEAQCELQHGNSQTFCPALQDPTRWCNMTKFESLFGSFHNLQHNFGQSMLMKTVITHSSLTKRYDNQPLLLPQPRREFCTNKSFAQTLAVQEDEWNKQVRRKKGITWKH